MKRLIRIIMWVLFIFALLIAGAYFLPRKVVVERDAIIAAPPKVVFAQINDLRNWEKWSKWFQIDPEMKVEFVNHGVGENSGYRWESNNSKVGNGELMILESVPYDSIVTQINFDDQGTAGSVFHFQVFEGRTKVIWEFTFDTGYNPFARWMGLFTGSFIGPDFEEGLANLNVVCKVQVQENSYVEELVELKAFYFASVREKVPFVEVSLEMGEMYGMVSSFIEAANTGLAGMPFAIYHEMEGEEIDLECGIPITDLVEGTKSIKTGTFPATKCATVDYYGDYRQLEDAHTALQAWIEEHKFKLAGSPIEFYMTDPSAEPDPEKWLTKIYYPVR